MRKIAVRPNKAVHIGIKPSTHFMFEWLPKLNNKKSTHWKKEQQKQTKKCRCHHHTTDRPASEIHYGNQIIKFKYHNNVKLKKPLINKRFILCVYILEKGHKFMLYLRINLWLFLAVCGAA
jgi:hypothetical protein